MVVLRLPEHGMLFTSLHSRRGRRIGRPIRISLDSYDEPHNLQSLPLIPVLTEGRALAAALVFDTDALLFEPLDARGRWVPIDGPEEESNGDEEQNPRMLQMARCGEIPCLLAAGG